MSIYSSAVKQPVTTALVFVAIVILGLFSLTRLSIDLFPEIETNTLMVITSYPGASASDVETNVSKPLENVLNTVSGLKHVTSSSRENSSVITLQFNYGIDVDIATNDVRDKLDMIKSSLPDGIQNPIIFKFGLEDIPIIILSVTADKSFPALNKVLDDKLANPLQRISGVGAVSISGIPKREIYVYCDPQKLELYGLTIEAVASVVSAENRNIPLGTMDIGSNSYALRVQGEIGDADELKNLVISNRGGQTVYLTDVARIEDTMQERAQEAYMLGKTGGMIFVQKQSGANSVDISRKVEAQLPFIQAQLPNDVELGVVINTSENIVNTINTLTERVLVTFILVMLVVLFFLGRIRATLIIIVTIPISLIAAFMYLLVSGNTINIISLSSLSIAIGMVVDDAIVVLENITTHIERGSRPKQAAIYATNEVAVSVVASTLTILAVFLPLTMITGLAGVLFEQLGWIVSIVMVISTVAALALTPMMSSRMLSQNSSEGWSQRLYSPIRRLLDGLDNLYAGILKWAVRHRTVVIILSLAIFFGSTMLLSTIGTDFFPSQDNSIISATIEMPRGTRTEVTRKLALEVDSLWRNKYPEIEISTFVVGTADEDNVFGLSEDNGPHLASFTIKLTGVKKRDKSMTEVSDLMRNDLINYPQIHSYSVVAGGSGGFGGGQTTVDVEVYGQDFEATDKIARELSEYLKDIDGFLEVNISRDEYMPEFQIDFDRTKLSQHGLNISMASEFVRNRINGITASLFREDGDEYNIKVRYAPEYRTSMRDIENILIYSPSGQAVRVMDVGEVKEIMTPPTIDRKNRERVNTVSAVIATGYALGNMVKETNTVIEKLDVPYGVSLVIAGVYEDQQESFMDLYLLMGLIMILVYIVMASQFESLISPFIIMLSVPFAFTGVFMGLAATGTPLNMMALIGSIMLIGIVVKNGIVLIDYINLNRERGMSVVAAVVDGGRSRLRPVLMTSLTTILGMLPMAFGTGEGAEMWRPMGLTVASGLAVSTLITLILVPVVYSVFSGVGLKRKRKKQRARENQI